MNRTPSNIFLSSLFITICLGLILPGNGSYGQSSNDDMPDVLVTGSFGFRESEWRGWSNPSFVVQSVAASQPTGTDAWVDSLKGEVISGRYPIGPPPAGAPSGCWVGGDVRQNGQALPNEEQGLGFSYDHQHVGSYYSRCGVNIHEWDASASFVFYVKGAAGTRFVVSGEVEGDEQLEQNDSSFGYRAKFTGGVNLDYSLANNAVSIFASGTTTGPTIEVKGEVYSKAFKLSTSGQYRFAYSNIMFCPHIPWHTSEANVSFNLNVAPYEPTQVEIKSIDDSDPEFPLITYELQCSANTCPVRVQFDDEERKFNLGSGTHTIEIPLIDLPPDFHLLTVAAEDPASSGDATDMAFFENMPLDEQTQVVRTSVLPVVSGFARTSATLSASVAVDQWEWSLPTIYDRRVGDVGYGIGTELVVHQGIIHSAFSKASYNGFSDNSSAPFNEPCLSDGYCRSWRDLTVRFGTAGESSINISFGGTTTQRGVGTGTWLFWPDEYAIELDLQ